MAPEIQLFQAQEKRELGEKKNPSGHQDGAAGPGSSTLALRGMEFPFPHWDLGPGLNQCCQHSMDGALPSSHSASQQG